MARCKGKNRNGQQCLRASLANTSYCKQHADQGLLRDSTLLGLGALAGHLFAPGLGGAIAGAAGAKILSWLAQPTKTSKARVFVSFDFDNDQGLKHLLIGQTQRKTVPFSVADGSLKEAAPEPRWKETARRSIRKCDLVVVLVGKDTHRAPGVLAEVAIAREENKPIVQLIGRKALTCRPVEGAGRVMSWTQTNLSKIFDI